MMKILIAIALLLFQATYPAPGPGRQATAAPSYSPMVTSAPPVGTPRTDAQGGVGVQFTAAAVTIQQLCRWNTLGNVGMHTVALIDAGGTIATVSIDASVGTPGTFQCVSIIPALLSSGTVYELMSSENSGEGWNSVESYTYDATFGSAFEPVYSSSTVTAWSASNAGGGFGVEYVPVSMTR